MDDNHFWLSIADTPWWVYGLFAYFLYVGIIATKPRTILVRQLVYATALFSGFSFFNFVFFAKPDLINTSIWLLCSSAACLFGFLQFRLVNIKAFKNEAKLSLPGTYIILALTLLSIASKYYTTLRFNITPEMMAGPFTQQLISAFYGAMNGYFAGKLIYAWRCMKHGPFVTT